MASWLAAGLETSWPVRHASRQGNMAGLSPEDHSAGSLAGLCEPTEDAAAVESHRGHSKGHMGLAVSGDVAQMHH